MKLKKIISSIKFFLLITIFINNLSFTQELRGTWISRDQLSSKQALATAIDSLAKNNFNVIYINAWSRGYPLWRSQAFYQHTGIYSDPTYSGRDIIAEAISEGHKHGLYVEAWFEYGFVGGWTGNQPVGKKGPIFDAHPGWVAKQQSGTEKDGSNFYWMIHTMPEVQDFLISLCTELTNNYDLDGIELDRIRYSSTSYGYDDFTDSLYRLENNNEPLPTDPNNLKWITWRANKLNDFMARCYDSIKAINPRIKVTNAPSLYSSSNYTSFYSYCQDWVWWVNNNKIDNVQVQSYVSNIVSFSNILNYIKTLINFPSKVFPAFAVAPNSTPLSDQTIYEFIDTIKSKGFLGQAVWYYTDLIQLLNKLKMNRFISKTYPPGFTLDYRENYRIIKLSDSTNYITKIGNWKSSLLQGYSGNSLYTEDTSLAELNYYIDVPSDGTYEVYAFQIIASDRFDQSNYLIYDSTLTNVNVKVNQTLSNNSRWYKLADVKLKKGLNKILTINNLGMPSGKRISSDAVMIIMNRKLTKQITKVNELNQKENKKLNLRTFPNPFNNSTKIKFTLNDDKVVKIKILNILGETVYNGYSFSGLKGENFYDLNLSNFSSGIYFCNLTTDTDYDIEKILLLK